MTERPDLHADESMVGPHGTADDHGDTHGHDDHAHGDDDAHGGATLGPVDVRMWGAALLGLVLGLAMVFAFVQAVS